MGAWQIYDNDCYSNQVQQRPSTICPYSPRNVSLQNDVFNNAGRLFIQVKQYEYIWSNYIKSLHKDFAEY